MLQRVKIFGRVGSGQKICASRVFSGRVGCYIILEIKLDFAFYYFQILPLSLLLFTLSLNPLSFHDIMMVNPKTGGHYSLVAGAIRELQIFDYVLV